MSTLELLLRAFEYGFMWRALIVGVAVAISSATIGSFLVLKKYAMIGHGLSHVAFAAVAIGIVLNQSPLFFSLPIVTFASVIVLRINQNARIHGDAAIGLMAATAMALGTTLVSTSGGFNIDLYSYLFGSILTIREIDVIFATVFSVIVIGFVLYNFNTLFSLTFDESFAKISGVNANRMNTWLAIFTGITVVIGIRAIGTLLISALIIFPAIIALQFSRGFKGTLILAVIISTLTVIGGLLLSFILDYPSGSTIVLLNSGIFFLIYIVRSALRLQT